MTVYDRHLKRNWTKKEFETAKISLGEDISGKISWKGKISNLKFRKYLTDYGCGIYIPK